MRNYYDAELDALLSHLPPDVAGELVMEAMEADPRFADWCAEEASRQQTAEDRAQTDAMSRRAARWLERYARAQRVGRTVREIGREAVTPRLRLTANQAWRDGLARGFAPLVDLPVAAGTGLDLWEEVSDTWLKVPDSFPPGDYLALPVRGDSMEAVLHDGDTVLIKVEPRVRVGAIIVARTPDDGYVVKYVESRDARGVRLASLNPEYPDTIAASDRLAIVGTVIARFSREDA